MISDRRARDHRGHRGYRLVHGGAHLPRAPGHRAGGGRPGTGVDRAAVGRGRLRVQSARPTRRHRGHVRAADVSEPPAGHRLPLGRPRPRRGPPSGRRPPGALVLSEPGVRSEAECLNAAIAGIDADYVAIDRRGRRLRPGLPRRHDAHVRILRCPGGRKADLIRPSRVAGPQRAALRRPRVPRRHRRGGRHAGLRARRRGGDAVPVGDRGTDAAFLADLRASGLRVFSSDRFNYVERLGRRSGEISDEDHPADAEPVGDGYAATEFFV